MRRFFSLALLAVLAAPAAGWLSAGDRGAACAMVCHRESDEPASCCRLAGSDASIARCSGTDPGALSPVLCLGLPVAAIPLFEPISAGRPDSAAIASADPGCPRPPDHVPLSSF